MKAKILCLVDVSAEGLRKLKMSTCILLCQPRLGCFLHKILAKWQVSWKMQGGLQQKPETMWTAEGMEFGKDKHNKQPKEDYSF